MAAFYLKALHLIFMVTWFAGLFYIVRLFIYHTEAQDKPDNEREVLTKQFRIMETRLWYGITWPSMILILVFGTWMLINNPNFLKEGWIHLKLAFIAALVIYHLYCGLLYRQLRKGIFRLSSVGLRILNEGATVFLFAIMFIAVVGRVSLKEWVWGVVGFVALMAVLFIAIRIYKGMRK